MDKFSQLLDTIEHPERYSRTDIETILQDPETREALVVLDKTKSSLTSIPTPDVEKEWTEFADSHSLTAVSRRIPLRALASRNIAATIAICIISFTMMATIFSLGIGSFNRDNADQNTDETTTATTAPSSYHEHDIVKTDSAQKNTTAEIIIFDNETLENIINSIAAHYGYTVFFNDDASKSLRLYFRWDQTLSVEDVAARLDNFEQIHVSIDDKTIKVD